MDAESALVLLRHHGPLALVVVMALNRLGLIPGGMAILITVGAFAGQGELSVAVAIVTAYIGTMIGDSALYGAGRFGLGWLTRRQERRSAWGRAHAAIERWGVPAVFLTRWLILPLTIAVSLICGINRFRYRPFVLLGAAGNLIFVITFLGIGYRFGDGWRYALTWTGAAVAQAFQSPAFLVGSIGLILAALVAYKAAPALKMKDEG
jgi:membrane-associated protein